MAAAVDPSQQEHLNALRDDFKNLVVSDANQHQKLSSTFQSHQNSTRDRMYGRDKKILPDISDNSAEPNLYLKSSNQAFPREIQPLLRKR
jgi:hypothetical protein